MHAQKVSGHEKSSRPSETVRAVEHYLILGMKKAGQTILLNRLKLGTKVRGVSSVLKIHRANNDGLFLGALHDPCVTHYC